MPSVGSTPTTTSPATASLSAAAQLQHQHQHNLNALSSAAAAVAIATTSSTHHPKLQQQHSLPLQLQYHQHHQQPQVTTTQPSPAGTFTNQAGIITTVGNSIGVINSNADDISLLSSSNSFSSVDTNQTLLNSIANQTQQKHPHQQQQSSNNNTANRTASCSSNRSYRSKYSQFMIITPAVSIDRDFENETIGGVGGGGSGCVNGIAGGACNFADNEFDDSYFNNGNIFRMSLLQGSIDSGNTSDSSFRSNYNPYLHHSRQHLLPKAAPHFYTFSSWRWCTLICAAMRCFGGGRSSNAPYSTSFARPARSSATPHRRLRSSSSFTAETAFEHFSAPFKPRKTRDHLNNITYEL